MFLFYLCLFQAPSLTLTVILPFWQTNLYSQYIEEKTTTGLCSNLALEHLVLRTGALVSEGGGQLILQPTSIVGQPTSFCYTSPVASLLLPAFTTLACHHPAVQVHRVQPF